VRIGDVDGERGRGRRHHVLDDAAGAIESHGAIFTYSLGH